MKRTTPILLVLLAVTWCSAEILWHPVSKQTKMGDPAELAPQGWVEITEEQAAILWTRDGEGHLVRTALPIRHAKDVAGLPVEMSQAEKDAVDAALLNASNYSRLQGLVLERQTLLAVLAQINDQDQPETHALATARLATVNSTLTTIKAALP